MIMQSSTRKILSNHLVGLFRDTEELSALTGKLLFHGEQYREALEFLQKGIDESDKKSENDTTFELIDLSIQAAKNLNDFSTEVELLLRKARLEKDLGRLIPSESTYNHIVEMLNETDHAVLLAQTYREMGEFYKMRNDYQSGIKVLEKALRLYDAFDDPLGLSNTLNNLGNTYWVAGDLDKAITHYQKALRIQEELNSDRDISTSLNNIGVIHTMRGDYDKAIANYNKSLQIRQELGDKGPIAQSWNNLGAVHFLRGDAVKASESFAHSLQLNRQVGAKAEELLNIENLAEATILAGRLPDALQYLKEGTELAEKLGETSHMCTVNRLTGQLLRRMGYYDDAADKYDIALGFAAEIDNRALILLCQLGLARLYLQLRENEKLERAVREGTQIADEMGDKNALFHLALLQISYTGEESFITIAKALVGDLDTARDKAFLYLLIR
jgi:tetratricopeptide (TPR) repeat protein